MKVSKITFWGGRGLTGAEEEVVGGEDFVGLLREVAGVVVGALVGVGDDVFAGVGVGFVAVGEGLVVVGAGLVVVGLVVEELLAVAATSLSTSLRIASNSFCFVICFRFFSSNSFFCCWMWVCGGCIVRSFRYQVISVLRLLYFVLQFFLPRLRLRVAVCCFVACWHREGCSK